MAGIVEHGKGARLFVLMSTLQEMSGARDKASVFFIKCDRSDHTAAAADEVHSLLPGYEVRPLKDYHFADDVVESSRPRRIHQRDDRASPWGSASW